ncbi:MAG: PSD1 domain-containing protein [Pirellulaceae bacterium]|nr:PSD1 domain-containing protein [Pirellulaceae bacterium]
MNIVHSARFVISAGLSILWLAGAIQANCNAADDLFYEQHIRPIFREYCFDCHGGGQKLEGNLDLRLVRFIEKGGDSGPALSRVDPAASLLLSMVASGDMPPGEAHVPAEKVDIIRAWLISGARTVRAEPESIGPGVPISEEDRQYWAYRPLVKPDLPAQDTLPSAARLRTPVDVWLQAAMPEGLTFSEDAPRRTLILRAYFDLTGLPPDQAELTRWMNEPEERWYSALLDHLLESPHYGERWARHWLDVAGYADSDGYTVADADRPWAWKYRDYVVRALNGDKPLDRFVTEQLAGDELAGPAQGDWTNEQIELLTATGFLRTAADGTGSGDDSPDARNKVIADTLKIVGGSLMGASLHCAQCHDHRYDPISHLDYHAIRSVFEPALDWQQWKPPAQRLVSLYTAADRARAAEIEAAAAAMVKDRDTKRDEYMQQALTKELEKYEEPLRAQLRTAYMTADKDRSNEQKALLAKHPSVNITPGVLYQYLPNAAEELKKLDKQISDKRAEKPVEEFVRVLTEPSDRAPLARLFHRGEHQQPQQEVTPAPPAIAVPESERIEFPKDDPAIPTTGRRLAFARWLTNPNNPMLPRVIVNRIWMHHFGQGLVATPAEFGKLGSTPTHPALLDWLAADFVQQGWSLKKLHRLILESTAWRQSSVRDAARQAIDPDNRFYWRKNLQRLDAEIIRDRMLAVVDRLDRQPFGAPVAIKEDDAGQVIVDGSQTRRSLYIRQRRTQPVAMLQTFDAPVMETNCEYRPVSTVATQSLMLLNGEFTIEQAGHLADRVLRDTKESEPSTLSDGHAVAALPALPQPKIGAWSYGTGTYDEANGKVTGFSSLPVWNGSRWQGAGELPGGPSGWAFLHAQGGHPGNASYAVIRRWTAAQACTLSVQGTFEHQSPHGDGTRGRLVSSRAGLLGTWTAHNNKVETSLKDVTVELGESLDFLVECIAHETSDSFLWPVKLQWKTGDGPAMSADSTADFHGPGLTGEQLARQVQYAWQLALARSPRASEMQAAFEFAIDQLTELRRDARGLPKDSTPERQVLVNLCQMLLNSNEFLYVD